MRIKKGDTVQVIAGKDKGKSGKVLKTFPATNRVVVEKVNMVTKHMKPRGPQNPGGIEKQEASIHVSNVMYLDTNSNKTTKLGYKFENGQKVRYQKSTGEIIK